MEKIILLLSSRGEGEETMQGFLVLVILLPLQVFFSRKKLIALIIHSPEQ